MVFRQTHFDRYYICFGKYIPKKNLFQNTFHTSRKSHGYLDVTLMTSKDEVFIRCVNF